jgi:DNA-binding NarL/FixJ family response regulator
VIRVVIVEDEMLVRRGIRGLLGLLDDIEVVAEAADGAEAVGVIQREKPDVVLMMCACRTVLAPRYSKRYGPVTPSRPSFCLQLSMTTKP